LFWLASTALIWRAAVSYRVIWGLLIFASIASRAAAGFVYRRTTVYGPP